MHAKFKLNHPDLEAGTETGWSKDGLRNPEPNDKYYIMNSDHIYNTGTVHDIHKYRLRRYQWKKIQLNK
jgi:hypothetical protein